MIAKHNIVLHFYTSTVGNIPFSATVEGIVEHFRRAGKRLGL